MSPPLTTYEPAVGAAGAGAGRGEARSAAAAAASRSTWPGWMIDDQVEAVEREHVGGAQAVAGAIAETVSPGCTV